jgi:pilus assembly protein Flp/PilA
MKRIKETIAVVVTAAIVDPATALKREEGQTLVEYALILALISVVAIALLATIGDKIKTVLTSVANAL